ncbi:hypothetical protein HUU62_08640 [Rhodoferax sp. 4810]|uniref:Uncharacterized protein n=1 Tax=Thiospirillum jenense TaxID=1653858 RepID=A0A839HH13_9GAMM|nr:hypothetical protein [Thiospirillum jenense]MBB1074476.1 hypothetical protein [Rhodoferax jenense]MBB1125542.1 hypothetical protein [Thiospirillum jenense]
MPAIRLCLARGSNTGTALTLGLPCQSTASAGDFAGVLPALVGDIQLRHIVAATVAASFPPMTGYANLDFNINLLPDTVSTAPFCWVDAAALSRGMVSAFDDGRALVGVANPDWQSAGTCPQIQAIAWDQSLLVTNARQTCWDDAAQFCGRGMIDWDQSLLVTQQRQTCWDDAALVGAGQAVCFVNLPLAAAGVATCWVDGDLVTRPLTVCFADGAGLRAPYQTCWDDAGLPERWKRPVFPPPTGDIPITRRVIRLCLGRGRNSGTRLSLGMKCVLEGRAYYMLQHDLSVRRLPDGPDIHVSNVSLKFDADSWAWSFSATVLGRPSLAALQPELDGRPATIEIRIDQYYWRVLVENWSHNRTFGKNAIQMSGRGLTAWLSDPYCLPTDGMLAEDRTFAQLLNERLPVDNSWELVYPTTTPDWLLPAGSYSWQKKTPIQAMHDAAQAVGLVLIPDRVLQRVTALPRYPILPWEFADELPSRVITDAGVLSCDGGAEGSVRANAVVVHGGSPGGIMARVYLSGTAGDHVASTVECPLVTDAVGARLLGSRVLSAQHTQPAIIQATMPMGGQDFPMLNVGEYVELLGSRGIVCAVDISAQLSGDRVAVRQSVTIGESTGNTFSRWLKLLPSDTLLVCHVDTVHGDDTCTVSPLAGGTMRVRGEANVDSWVYVRGGVIESVAPALQGMDIDV